MKNEFVSCRSCKISKPFSEYYPSSLRIFSFCCKECHKIRVKKWRNKNPSGHIRHRKNHDFKLRYGITLDDFDKMVAKQNNKCLICNQSPTKTKAFQTWNLHVDHCHSSGNVRGLLCHLCNRGLGLFKDNIELLQKAIQYLIQN